MNSVCIFNLFILTQKKIMKNIQYLKPCIMIKYFNRFLFSRIVLTLIAYIAYKQNAKMEKRVYIYILLFNHKMFDTNMTSRQREQSYGDISTEYYNISQVTLAVSHSADAAESQKIITVIVLFGLST